MTTHYQKEPVKTLACFGLRLDGKKYPLRICSHSLYLA